MLTLQELTILHLSEDEEQQVSHFILNTQEELFEKIIDIPELRYILDQSIGCKLVFKHLKKWYITGNLKLRCFVSINTMLELANKGYEVHWWCTNCNKFGAPPKSGDRENKIYKQFTCDVCKLKCPKCNTIMYSKSLNGMQSHIFCCNKVLGIMFNLNVKYKIETFNDGQLYVWY